MDNNCACAVCVGIDYNTNIFKLFQSSNNLQMFCVMIQYISKIIGLFRVFSWIFVVLCDKKWEIFQMTVTRLIYIGNRSNKGHFRWNRVKITYSTEFCQKHVWGEKVIAFLKIVLFWGTVLQLDQTLLLGKEFSNYRNSINLHRKPFK